MFRLLLTIFLVSAGVFLYSYFRELNPGTVLVHTSSSVQFELSPVTLVLFAMAIGAVVVTFVVGVQQTAYAIVNWRSNRLVRRKEKVDVLHREGTHAFMSKRTLEAISLFERALAMDPNRVVPTAVAIIDVNTIRSRLPGMKPPAVAANTSPAQRSRCLRQKSCATGPPIE